LQEDRATVLSTGPRLRGAIAAMALSLPHVEFVREAGERALAGGATQATDLAFSARRTGDVRLITGVSAAHFVSHFYLLVLPPLFDFVRTDYCVSYTELGLALTVLNVVSAIFQTPAGFLIDRIDARLALVAALLIGALGFVIAAAVATEAPFNAKADLRTVL
jgi:MFS family permease